MSERINPYDVAAVRKAVAARRRTYSPEQSADIEAKVKARTAALTAETTQLRTALRETREALECVVKPSPQLVEEQAHWILLRQKAKAVLARHAHLDADLAKESPHA